MKCDKLRESILGRLFSVAWRDHLLKIGRAEVRFEEATRDFIYIDRKTKQKIVDKEYPKWGTTPYSADN